MHIFIITGGHVDVAFAAGYLEEMQPDCIIAADHGLEVCRKLELMPEYVYGDFDSVKTEDYAYFAEKIPERIHRFSSRKDETDTELALREAIALIRAKQSALPRQEADDVELPVDETEITILGATGTRLDHVYANLLLLKTALDAGIPCYLVDEHNRICMIDQTKTIYRDEQFGDYVSFLPFGSAVEGVTLKGFEYPLDDFRMESGCVCGVSNEIREEVAEVSIRDGILVMFETRD